MSFSSGRKSGRVSTRAYRFILPLYVRWQRGSRLYHAITATALAATLYVGASLSATLLEGTCSVVIVAAPVPVEVSDPYSCSAAATSRTEQHGNPVYTPTNPRIVQGFPATPQISDGFLADDPTADAILFTARSSKLPNGPILSTGSSMLFNTDQDEYRLLWLKASLNHTAIYADEGVESDVCVTVVPQSKRNSVSSGEELFCSHEHFYGGDYESIGQSIFYFGPGGFPLGPDTKLDIASVSKIYTAIPFSQLNSTMVRLRDAPAEPIIMPFGKVGTSLDLLALNYEALIVPSNNNVVMEHVGLRSVRSPLRDRSVLPLPNSEVLPLTMFKNTKPEPVTVHGLGIFRSMLGHYVFGDTLIRVLVDGRELGRFCPTPHRPSETTSPFDAVVPLSINIPSDSIIRVEHNLTAHMQGRRVYKPTPYDLAVYILYEHPDVSSDALIATGEDELGNGELDLNNDGFAGEIFLTVR